MVASPVEILLVEDNRFDLELTMRALHEKRMCNKISVARDGAEALDFVFCQGKYCDRSKGDLPLVVLLDLNLPLVDGKEVLRQIRADPRTSGVPVVVLTSSSHERDAMESLSLGVNSYIPKPVVFALFSNTSSTR